MALDFREDPLAQATVPCDNPVRYLRITCSLLVLTLRRTPLLWQEVVVTALTETAYGTPLSH